MADLIELAERVEKGADVKWLTSDIDDLTRALIGPSWTMYDRGFADDAIRMNSLDAVVALLERVLPGWDWCRLFAPGEHVNCYVRSPCRLKEAVGTAARTERALLSATLRALSEKDR